MADMELVIKLDEEEYINIKNAINSLIENGVERTSMSKVCLAILDGTPLPKGHGRLGDLDALEQEMINGIKAGNYEDGYDYYPHINNIDDCVECVGYEPTIIEADRKDNNENNKV